MDEKLKKKPRKKVFVGLSGGVDSSVSAALLRDEGYDVTGVFIKTWHPDFLPCAWKEDRLDAMRVAAHLDIPFITFDAEEEYKKDVADYMIEEYRRGRTPNPDVMCNKYVKFGAFLKYALMEGADFVATGHYARLRREIRNPKSEIRNDSIKLLTGTDTNKDQSYFLWTLTQEQLKHILFPVGHLEKSEVRKLAKKFGLPTAEKKDSQGVCFLGKLDMGEFLKHYAEPKRGDVLNEKGETIGFHEGAILYTLGERHGFTITKKGVLDAPYFVVKKDMRANTVTIAHKDQGSLKGKGEQTLFLENVNWISSMPEKDKIYSARARYRAALSLCKIVTNGNETHVEFCEPEDPQAPGQSLVVYDKEECLGGGIIK
jgi:tRNA-specific 2-thiouridylase